MADVVSMVIFGVFPHSVGWLWHFRRMSVSTYISAWYQNPEGSHLN